MRILAYVYHADYWCPCCTREAVEQGDLKVVASKEVVDQHGLPQYLRTKQDEPIGIVFSTDTSEHEQGIRCGGCGHELVEPTHYLAQWDGFSIRMCAQAVRECSAPGDCEEACRYWVDKCGQDWSKVSTEALAEELQQVGAWTEEDLRDEDGEWDEELIRMRVLWVSAGNVLEYGQ
jgi:hypothetical protein